MVVAHSFLDLSFQNFMFNLIENKNNIFSFKSTCNSYGSTVKGIWYTVL